MASRLILIATILLCYMHLCDAFISTLVQSVRHSTEAHGISEWRDLPPVKEFVWQCEDEGFAREVPLLLMDSDLVLLQGQTKYLHFNDDDEIRLFQQAVDRNHGIFGLGLLYKSPDDEDDTILLDKIPLMEIREYNMMGVDLGIFCSARVVGRAVLLESEIGTRPGRESKQGPLSALCAEVFDRPETVDIKTANMLADDAVKAISEICRLESPNPRSSRRHDDGEFPMHSRIERLKTAYEDALSTDSQGYIVPTLSDSSGRSWQEIDALSWAVFSTNPRFHEDATYRLSALDIGRITDRLRLANFWLSDVLIDMKQTIRK